MKRACIAIIDAARARLFAYEEGAAPTSQLRELRVLVSPGRPLPVRDMVSNTEPGRASAADGGGTSRGYERSATDDHRDARVSEMDSKFAKEVVDEITRLVNQDGFLHLILAAPPKMLGTLRKAANGVLQRSDLRIDDIPQELTTLTPAQLHDHLASLALIPNRTRLAAAR